MRTTSSLESFNAVLNRSLVKHGHFFEFTMRLKFHESRKSDEMYYLMYDDVPHNQLQRRKKCDKEREKKVQTNTALLMSGVFSIREFMNAMADDGNSMYI